MTQSHRRAVSNLGAWVKRLTDNAEAMESLVEGTPRHKRCSRNAERNFRDVRQALAALGSPADLVAIARAAEEAYPDTQHLTRLVAVARDLPEPAEDSVAQHIDKHIAHLRAALCTAEELRVRLTTAAASAGDQTPAEQHEPTSGAPAVQ